jgi:hypothetical protein
VVERRNTIPILSNVLIEARDDGSIRLMATDLDLQVDESVPAQVAVAGATTVSAHTFFDIVRKLPEGSQVELSASEGKMQVVAGRARFNLSTLPRDDFPVIAEGELPTRFELPSATLRQIIDKTRFAISSEETRYYLMGIFLHVADDKLKAAATDGHRLARVTVDRPEGSDGMPDVIIPKKCVVELRPRRRGNRRRLWQRQYRDRLQRPLPDGHPRPDRRRHGRSPPRRRGSPNAAPRKRQEQCAVCADADARLSHQTQVSDCQAIGSQREEMAKFGRPAGRAPQDQRRGFTPRWP